MWEIDPDETNKILIANRNRLNALIRAYNNATLELEDWDWERVYHEYVNFFTTADVSRIRHEPYTEIIAAKLEEEGYDIDLDVFEASDF